MNDRKPLVVAIDGPAGAGKSTIARRVANDLDLLYVDTGALYRAIGYQAIRRNLDPTSEADVRPLLNGLKLELKYVEGRQQVWVDGEDVSEAIRLPESAMAASAVAALPVVRQFLLQLQREMAARQDVVMDGRDIATVVLPGADVKVFLTASAEVRARRRWKELTEKGIPASFEEVLEDMQKRDYDDSHRAAAPLRQAPDAVLLDTSGLDFEQSVDRLKALVMAARARQSEG